jgi:hypothetical protein
VDIYLIKLYSVSLRWACNECYQQIAVWWIIRSEETNQTLFMIGYHHYIGSKHYGRTQMPQSVYNAQSPVHQVRCITCMVAHRNTNKLHTSWFIKPNYYTCLDSLHEIVTIIEWSPVKTKYLKLWRCDELDTQHLRRNIFISKNLKSTCKIIGHD